MNTNRPEKDCMDVDLTLAPANPGTEELIELSLPDVVASGRLFILNQRGEYEQVVVASYWKGNSLLGVCRDGYEWNEDGEITRDWR